MSERIGEETMEERIERARVESEAYLETLKIDPAIEAFRAKTASRVTETVPEPAVKPTSEKQDEAKFILGLKKDRTFVVDGEGTTSVEGSGEYVIDKKPRTIETPEPAPAEINASAAEINRLKSEIDILNKLVQGGTSKSGQYERKVLENETRIHELEKGTAPTAEVIPPTPAPTPEAAPAAPATPEVVPPALSPEMVSPAPAPAPEVIPPAPATTPEVAPPAPTTPEAIPLDRYRFSPSNKNLWERMKDGGKNILSTVYEKVHGSVQDIPRTTTFLGKMEVAYNQFWLERYENKAMKIKAKADGLDLRINSIIKNQEDSRKLIAEYKRENMPGAESLEASIRDGELKKNKLLDKKDIIQSKFEARDNKRKVWMEKRDLVAGELINYFETKLSPIELRLETHQNNLDSLDLDIAVMKARHAECELRINRREQMREKQAEIMRRMNRSESEIRSALGPIDDGIKADKQRNKREKDEIKNDQIRISKEMASLEEKANPLRDKREIFVRAKNNRGINIEMEARTAETETTESATVTTRPRAEAISVESSTVEPETPTTPEEAENLSNQTSIEESINAWNAMQRENRADEKQQIDVEKFSKEIRFGKDQKLSPKNFTNILAKYYKVMKLPKGTLIKDMKKIEEKLTIK